MRDKLCAIIPIFALAGSLALAGSDTTWQATTGTNTLENVMVTATNTAFRGELDSLHVYVPDSGTGTVSFVLLSPYGGPSLVLATNDVTSGYRVFMPRETITHGTDGAAARLVNADGLTDNQMFRLSGETIRATYANGGVTNRTVRFRAVFKKE